MKSFLEKIGRFRRTAFGTLAETLFPSKASLTRFEMRNHYGDAIKAYWDGHTGEGNEHREKHKDAAGKLVRLTRRDEGRLHPDVVNDWFADAAAEQAALERMEAKSLLIRRHFDAMDKELSRPAVNRNQKLVDNYRDEIRRLRNEIWRAERDAATADSL